MKKLLFLLLALFPILAFGLGEPVLRNPFTTNTPSAASNIVSAIATDAAASSTNLNGVIFLIHGGVQTAYVGNQPLNRAISNVVSGDTILLSATTFSLTNQIVWPSGVVNVTVAGDGGMATLIGNYSNNIPSPVLPCISYGLFRNLIISNNLSESSPASCIGVHGNDIRAGGYSNWVGDNLILYGASDTYYNRASNTFVGNNLLKNSTLYGGWDIVTAFGTTGNTNTVVNLDFENCKFIFNNKAIHGNAKDIFVTDFNVYSTNSFTRCYFYTSNTIVQGNQGINFGNDGLSVRRQLRMTDCFFTNATPSNGKDLLIGDAVTTLQNLVGVDFSEISNDGGDTAPNTSFGRMTATKFSFGGDDFRGEQPYFTNSSTGVVEFKNGTLASTNFTGNAAGETNANPSLIFGAGEIISTNYFTRQTWRGTNDISGGAAINSQGNFKTAAYGTPTEVNFGTAGIKTNGLSLSTSNAVNIVNNGTNVLTVSNGLATVLGNLNVNGVLTTTNPVFKSISTVVSSTNVWDGTNFIFNATIATNASNPTIAFTAKGNSQFQGDVTVGGGLIATNMSLGYGSLLGPLNFSSIGSYLFTRNMGVFGGYSDGGSFMTAQFSANSYSGSSGVRLLNTSSPGIQLIFDVGTSGTTNASLIFYTAGTGNRTGSLMTSWDKTGNQISPGSITATNGFYTYTGSNYFGGQSYILTNTAPFTLNTNNFVIGTRYTNLNQRAFIAASFQLTAAVAGTAAVTFNVEQDGKTNRLSVSAGPLASLVTVEPMSLMVGPNAPYYFTDTSSGSGASAAVVVGSSSITYW